MLSWSNKDNVKEGNWINTLEANKWKIEQIVLKEIESRRETKKNEKETKGKKGILSND